MFINFFSKFGAMGFFLVNFKTSCLNRLWQEDRSASSPKSIEGNAKIMSLNFEWTWNLPIDFHSN